TAAIVAGVELAAGVALIAGILTPLAGILLGVDMVGAFYFVHATNGPFVAENGWELVVALGVGALLIAAVGAGRFSVDRVLGGGTRPSLTLRTATSSASAADPLGTGRRCRPRRRRCGSAAGVRARSPTACWRG